MPLTEATVRKDNAHARFHMLAVKNEARSEAEGRPIFEDKEMVEIRIPGDKHISWVGPVTEQTKIDGHWVDSRQRFPEAYAAFKRGEQVANTGTPLEQWPNPKLTAARVAELKALNIFSVEDLASVSDSNLGRMGMGARELRNDAQKYIETAKVSVDPTKILAEMAQLREMVAKLSAGQPPEGPTKDTATDKPIEECTDDELKAYIKKHGGVIKGNPGRATLCKRVIEIQARDPSFKDEAA